MMPESSLAKLRIWGYLEGISLIALVFVAMPLKYYWDTPEAVKFVGLAHGAFFIFYCIWLLVVSLKLKWPIQNAVWSFLAAFVPGGTIVADRKIFRNYLDK